MHDCMLPLVEALLAHPAPGPLVPQTLRQAARLLGAPGPSSMHACLGCAAPVRLFLTDTLQPVGTTAPAQAISWCVPGSAAWAREWMHLLVAPGRPALLPCCTLASLPRALSWSLPAHCIQPSMGCRLVARLAVCLAILTLPTLGAAAGAHADLLQAGRELQPWLVGLRRHLHQRAPGSLDLARARPPADPASAGGQSWALSCTTPVPTCARSWTRSEWRTGMPGCHSLPCSRAAVQEP